MIIPILRRCRLRAIVLQGCQLEQLNVFRVVIALDERPLHTVRTIAFRVRFLALVDVSEQL